MRTLLLFLFALALLSSCHALEVLESAGSQPPTATAPAPAATDDDVPADVQPAPANYTAAQQRRYYQAQQEARRQAVPRKQKNSNNQTTTYQQKISNVGVVPMLLIVTLSAGLGLVVGIGVGRKTAKL